MSQDLQLDVPAFAGPGALGRCFQQAIVVYYGYYYL